MTRSPSRSPSWDEHLSPRDRGGTSRACPPPSRPPRPREARAGCVPSSPCAAWAYLWKREGWRASFWAGRVAPSPARHRGGRSAGGANIFLRAASHDAYDPRPGRHRARPRSYLRILEQKLSLELTDSPTRCCAPTAPDHIFLHGARREYHRLPGDPISRAALFRAAADDTAYFLVRNSAAAFRSGPSRWRNRCRRNGDCQSPRRLCASAESAPPRCDCSRLSCPVALLSVAA